MKKMLLTWKLYLYMNSQLILKSTLLWYHGAQLPCLCIWSKKNPRYLFRSFVTWREREREGWGGEMSSIQCARQKSPFFLMQFAEFQNFNWISSLLFSSVQHGNENVFFPLFYLIQTSNKLCNVKWTTAQRAR